MRRALLVVVAACSAPEKKQVVAPAPAPPPVVVEAPKPPARLWTDAEAQQLADAALASIGQNATRACPAPPIGKPSDGASTDEVFALVTGRTPCLKKLATGSFDADAIEKACREEVATAVRHAAAYRSGCSPFIVGVRPMPDALLPILNLARLLATHAKTTKDVPTLLAGMRVMEDVARGHTSLLLAMTSTAAIGILAKRLDDLVETAKFAKAEVAVTTKTLSELVDGAPSLGEIIAGEHEWAVLTLALPLIEPTDWKAPGAGSPMRTTLPTGRHPHDVGTGLLLGIMKAAADDDHACPPGAPLATCRDQVLFSGLPSADDPWRLVERERIVDAIANSMHVFGPYVKRHGETYEQLVTIGSKLGLKGL